MEEDDVQGNSFETKPPTRNLPADLPTSLDDAPRHAEFGFVPETEMYDAWQGKV